MLAGALKAIEAQRLQGAQFFAGIKAVQASVLSTLATS
jgi:hypothetical protein